MRASEIRKDFVDLLILNVKKGDDAPIEFAQLRYLSEIAAQLAELNEQLRKLSDPCGERLDVRLVQG